MEEKEPLIKDAWWRYMTNTWCIIAYIAIIYDFIYNNELHEILPSILVIYVGLLVIFAGVKEFERWFDIRQDRHPGEIFVIGWTVIVVGIVSAKIFLHKSEYKFPDEIISTYIAVLSIMAITQKSKKLKEHKS